MSDTSNVFPTVNAAPLEDQILAATVVVMFEAGKDDLSNAEADVLRHWISGWPVGRGAKLISIGGACETSRRGRLRRLNSFGNRFDQFGLPSKCIRHDEDWSRPSCARSMGDLPADVVWIQLIESQRGEVPIPSKVAYPLSEFSLRKDRLCTKEF